MPDIAACLEEVLQCIQANIDQDAELVDGEILFRWHDVPTVVSGQFM